MKQGEVAELKTGKMSSDGSCIARTPDGLVVFVTGALPGELVRARVVIRKKEYAVARLEEVITAASGRRQAPCPVFGRCGGCQLQHADYGLQLEMKRSAVQDAFERIYRQPFHITGTCRPSPDDWNYRNKTSLPVGTRAGKTESGYYARGSHDIVPVRSCPVLAKELESLPGVFHRAISRLNLPAYNEKTGEGLIRHLILRRAGGAGEVLASVVAARRFSRRERNLTEKVLLPELESEIKGLKSFTINYNFIKGNVILGSETEVLLGSGYITEFMDSMRFKYDTTAFFQVNPDMAAIMYREAAAMALSGGAGKILELYSGVGTLTCFLAREGADVTAVEEWPAAAALMKENAALNGLADKIRVLAGTAEDSLDEAGGGCGAVVVDPPRSGCSREVLDRIGAISPQRVVYVSCNPATLARDAAILLEKGYRPTEIKCFDMFPQTVHVETAVLFEK